MRITTLASAAAVALAATFVTANAADRFTTLDGISAVAMSSSELGGIRGTHRHIVRTNPVTGEETLFTVTFVAAGFGAEGGGGPGGALPGGIPGHDISFFSADGSHMQNAEIHGNGVIDVCNFGADSLACSP